MPWLKRAAAAASRERRVVAVVVPFQSDAYHLKALALAAGIGLLGVHFITPGELRDRLAAHAGIAARVPTREHMHLLIATAAERVAARRGEELATAATAPDQLLKAMDLVSDGGWSFAEVGPAALRPIVAEFERLLKATGFSSRQDIDRALLAVDASESPYFADLFVIGFNALHWPQWPLLQAAVRASAAATVCLTDPRMEGEDLDGAWVGTWEETFGAAEPVASDFIPPLTDLLRLPESTVEREKRASHPAPEIAFLVGQDTSDQARAIVAQALHFLSDNTCHRLGILFPSAGALSRRVAGLLAESEVPHQDGLAHHAPGPLENAVWPAWLALQESPRLPSLVRFLKAQPDGEFAGLGVERASDELQRVYQELLLDDLAVLAEYLAHHSRRNHAPALATALRALPFLPERAPLSEMIERTDSIFRELRWTERADKLADLTDQLVAAAKLEVSRRVWLRWLGETLESWKAERATPGAHPYSRLHLLPYAQAESQTWTHIIAAGLNEGQWPPSLEDAGYLGEEEIDALNDKLRKLNTRIVTQGRQGEGHVAVLPGKAFCLGPAQRRTLAARQFYNTLESATVAIAISAQLHDEAAPDRQFNASEFFAQLYFCTRGRAVAQDTMAALHAETKRWMDASNLWKSAAPDPAVGHSTRRAYDARRTADAKFGEYEFALTDAPKPALRLAAKRWEDALAAPAIVWLSALLGVESDDNEDETPWALAQGNWVHDWLRAITGAAPAHTLSPLPSPADLQARVRTTAADFRDRVSSILSTQRRVVPDWWTSAWDQALGIAMPLAKSVAAVTGRTHAAAEWKLEETDLALEHGKLRIRGRIDLILTVGDSLADVWLIDYKTGNRKALRTKDLAAGDGVQLALYALALREAGASAVGLSLLTPGAALDDPQLKLIDLDSLTALWNGLLKMQETGVFGMHGALREEYGFRGGYPLATLAIDEEILADKWKLTHPDLARNEDEA